MSELEMLKEWQDERHAEIRVRLDRIDERLYRIEELPVLKASVLVDKLTTRKGMALTAIPGIGGVAYLFDRLRDLLS